MTGALIYKHIYKLSSIQKKRKIYFKMPESILYFQKGKKKTGNPLSFAPRDDPLLLLQPFRDTWINGTIRKYMNK